MSDAEEKVNFVQKSQIDQFIVKFFNFYRLRGMSEKTIERIWFNIRQFPEFIDGKEINKNTVREYVLYCKCQKSKSTNGLGNGKELRTASVNSIISSLKQFVRWLWLEESFLEDDLSGCIKALKRDAFFPTLLTVDEIRAIIHCPLKRDKWHQFLAREYFDFFFELIACTGLRRGEAIGLNVEDLDFDEMVLRVMRAKFDKPRLVPIPQDLGFRLQEWLEKRKAKPEEPLFRSFLRNHERIKAATVIDELNRRARFLGIKKRVYLHLFRHCFITELIKSDAPAMKVARIVGHSSINSTLRYTHLVVDDLKGVIENHPLNRSVRKENEDFSKENFIVKNINIRRES